jgi:putative transposase
MEGKRYPSDMTDEEWAILEPLIPDSRSGGPPRSANMHEVLNGIFYVLRGGIPWRFLPKEFPSWKTVYHYFRLWRMDATWEMMNARLREQVRRRSGRETTPSAGVMDSPSAKTTERREFGATTGARR